MTTFTIAHWCMLVAALMPIACAGAAKWGSFGRPRKEGGFDNHSPRDWLAKQTGFRARANAAQANCFEALPFFLAAVLAALQLQASVAVLSMLALVWVLLRLLYVLMYLADMPNIRSVIWALALAVNIGILFAGYR
jgi:uncharacterized MAPEG superfamily protein